MPPALNPDRWTDINEDGAWCPSCGDLVAGNWAVDDDDWREPEQCSVCGFPEDLDACAIYHLGED